MEAQRNSPNLRSLSRQGATNPQASQSLTPHLTINFNKKKAENSRKIQGLIESKKMFFFKVFICLKIY
jgi:hypothetical protein